MLKFMGKKKITIFHSKILLILTYRVKLAGKFRHAFANSENPDETAH